MPRLVLPAFLLATAAVSCAWAQPAPPPAPTPSPAEAASPSQDLPPPPDQGPPSAPALAIPPASKAPAPGPVEVTQLAAPDAFSTPGRDTGLPGSLWRGTPIDTARAVLPLLATRPLTPAAASLARRILATGARGPDGSATDASLAGARVNALIALGDPAAAARILDRASGLDRNGDLARAAAESALLAGDTARACGVATGLAEGRSEIYWLRLRAYCQALAGQAEAARLTFELAVAQAKDPVFARLMSAKLSGSPPGPASLRNGLDYALSRDLGLDLSTAKPSPAVAVAISGMDPQPPSFDVSAIDADVGGMASAVAHGPPPAGGLSALIAAAHDAKGKGAARLQAAALLISALAPDLAGPDRALISDFSLAEGKAPVGRDLALEAAADGKRRGEAALLALWTCADAGEKLVVADRVRIVHALAKAGLEADARAFALEGLADLK